MIDVINIHSTAIANNPMGNSHQRQLPVYLPPNYDATRSQPYPVIFVLAGYADYSEKYLWQKNCFQPSLPEQLDHAIISGDCPDVIIAFPDGSTKLGGSQYINSPVNGNFMDYICDECVMAIDNTFHTYQDRDHRAIMGHSSGGFAALVTGMLRPDAFGSILSSAGDSFYEMLYLPCITNTINAIEQFGSITNFISTFLCHPNPGATGYFDAFMTLAMASCLAPNSKIDTIMGDVFFDINTGAIIEEVWQRYLAWDPLRMVAHHLDALASLNHIQLECGLQDPYGMQWGHRQIAAKLTTAGIDCELKEYPGKHGGHGWRHLERIKNLLTYNK